MPEKHRQLRGRARILWLLTAAALTGLAFCALPFMTLRNKAPLNAPAIAAASTAEDTTVPVLSHQGMMLDGVMPRRDEVLYTALFTQQEAGNWEGARELETKVADATLMGYVLAERYLSKSYNATYPELVAWLKNYADQPQAFSIYRQAMTKRHGHPLKLPELAQRSTLKGYGVDHGTAARDDSSARDTHWQAGLDAWQAADYRSAATHFSAMAAAESLSAWDRSAASFWAWRAYKKLGNDSEASHYLTQAANEPRTFYGILARKTLGRPIGVAHTALPALEEEEAAFVHATPALRRAIALAQVGRTEDAEAELRLYFTRADTKTRALMISVAAALDLPALQITMAQSLQKEGISYDAALYPMPGWLAEANYAVDPALVFAFARQESGFHAEAKSQAGALGIMQLMPATARAMKRGTALHTLPKEAIFEPETNITLGQTYINHLIKEPMVGGNLVFLAAAYNAGPGRLLNWKRSIRHRGDALLFMESIPYSETRRYVAQVLTNYWIYQELEGRTTSSAAALAKGQWPAYAGDGWNAVAKAF